MNIEQQTVTVHLGDPSALKKFSMVEIERTLSEALTQLSGEQLSVSINNLEVHVSAAAALTGGKPSVTFDVAVHSKTEEHPSPF